MFSKLTYLLRKVWIEFDKKWDAGGKKCSFFGKLDVLCFLETPVLRFYLLSYYQPTLELTS